ncbi:hypothetical protein BDZ97DRAFT_587911 [Flammula alnicola]|nr:hypothetical protein BDZ97DRAFT_587911 [Flammula alnicola]
MDNRFNRFKFASSSKPPPLPPKDYIYQRTANPSQPSLFAADSTAPSSPLSPSIQYAIRRANSPSPSPLFSFETSNTTTTSMTNNNSTPSLVLSPPPPNADAPSVTNNRQTTMSVASKKDKALAFLKFSKRSPRSPPPGTSSSAPSTSSSGSVIVIGNSISASSNGSDEGDLPPPAQEDEGISLPWNFQVCLAPSMIQQQLTTCLRSIIFTWMKGMCSLLLLLLHSCELPY